MDKNFLFEKEHLEIVKNDITNITKEEQERLIKLPRMYSSDPRLLESLMSITSLKLNNLHNSLSKPYFARIDFIPDLDNKKIVSYIGKVGIMADNGDMIVTDWRAPIASIYYDSNLGEVNYKVEKIH
jgi:DNA helicase-2/ATP-dependent DNA helicase PcrA